MIQERNHWGAWWRIYHWEPKEDAITQDPEQDAITEKSKDGRITGEPQDLQDPQ